MADAGSDADLVRSHPDATPAAIRQALEKWVIWGRVATYFGAVCVDCEGRSMGDAAIDHEDGCLVAESICALAAAPVSPPERERVDALVAAIYREFDIQDADADGWESLAAVVRPFVSQPEPNEDARMGHVRLDETRAVQTKGQSLYDRIGWMIQLLHDEKMAAEAELRAVHADLEAAKRQLEAHEARCNAAAYLERAKSAITIAPSADADLVGRLEQLIEQARAKTPPYGQHAYREDWKWLIGEIDALLRERGERPAEEPK